MVSRFLEKQVLESLKPGKVIGLFGPRRSGKTVLMERIREHLVVNQKVLLVQGDNLETAEVFSSQKSSILQKAVLGYDFLFIDEAQKIPKIGLNLKLLVDMTPSLSIFITGSSAFDLKQKIGEPLVGRSYYYYLYPIAQLELKDQEDFLKSRENLETQLIYGMYPQVLTAKSLAEKKKELESVRDGYLLKDILELDNLKDSLFIFNLLRLIAFQIGNDISYSELAANLNVNRKTVMRYLELLQKCYVLFSLGGYSRNLRKEYTKTPRFYFCDNGVRNAIISNFNSLNSRDDVGKLWENYCISERIKKTTYQGVFLNRYYWRTYDQKEIDLVEEKDGQLFGFEMKWGNAKTKLPKEFLQTYPSSSFQIVNRDNYLEFIS